MDELERLLTEISGGEAFVGTLEGRVRVAASCGYIDARFMVHMMETHGLPLSISALEAARKGLKVDRGGLRHELERIGKKPATIESELKEIDFFIARQEESHVH